MAEKIEFIVESDGASVRELQELSVGSPDHELGDTSTASYFFCTSGGGGKTAFAA
ncbi:hypothetical protein [Streptacidiphilus sp. EB103A]|uniref:hypothetical protein n=1 Tax=Streptacidiphilus sp. EB103A TaxID=3156275 RepID=UPI0035121C8C